MDINTATKLIAKGYVNNLNISNFLFAVYTGNGIKIDNKPNQVPLKFVTIPKKFTDYDIIAIINGVEQTITIKNALKTGDRLVIGMASGAQQYIVLDRI